MSEHDEHTSKVRHAFLEAVFTTAVDAIVVIDDHGNVQAVNPATSVLFGYESAEVIGKNVSMLVPAPFRDEHDGYLQNYRDSGIRKIIGIGREVIGQRKDGSTFPMHLAVSETQFESKRVFVGIVRDITDLKVRQARLEAIMDNAVDAIITIDKRGIVQSVNPATKHVFGYEESEVVGQNVKQLMPSPYHEEHDGYLSHYHETGQRKIIGKGREVTGQRKDGTTFPMHLAVSEIEVAGQKMFTGIVRDITDLKKAENQLRELNDELEARVQQRTQELHEAQAELVRKEKMATLGQVSGGIAHEIRNPLNVVRTSVYYLVNAKNPTPEKVGEHLERIDRQVAMIDNVVTALSDVARLPDPHLESCEIRALIASVTSTTTLPDDIKIDIELSPETPAVMIDANQIPIVFRNLIRNARDAMPGGGTITISADATDEQVNIYVKDEGIGIPQDEIDKIMEPLYSTKARGMGLGLAISKTIVQKK